MKIRVFSRSGAEAFEPPKVPYAWISIVTPGDSLPNIQRRKPWDLGIKYISFHDIDDAEPGVDVNGNPYIRPDLFAAREIYSFVHWVKFGVKELYVHCDAGISRSAGVAAALSKIYNDDDSEFFKAPYHPNRLIYRLILEVHNRQGSIGNIS